MPLATAKAVITQVPWDVLTPRLPEMVGSETLAMVESSTCMKVPIASIKAVIASWPPCMGACDACTAAAARPPVCGPLSGMGAVLAQDARDHGVGGGTGILTGIGAGSAGADAVGDQRAGLITHIG